jgi:WhiB family transcriptional regulator, redox-sensing transcriptional regulator
MFRLRLSGGELIWRDKAACKGYPEPDDFFSDNENITKFVVKRFCGNCEVRAECLAEALPDHRLSGVWGGLTLEQRSRLRNSRSRI